MLDDLAAESLKRLVDQLKLRSDREHARLKPGELYWAADGDKWEIVVYLGVSEKPRLKPKNADVLYDNRIVQYWPEELIEVTEENIKSGRPDIGHAHHGP